MMQKEGMGGRGHIDPLPNRIYKLIADLNSGSILAPIFYLPNRNRGPCGPVAVQL